MALPVQLSLTRRISHGFLQNYLVRIHNKSTSTNKWDERVVVTDDGSTVVCWHPEKPFPYECSKPIPENITEDTNSVLKVQNISEVYDVFKPKSDDETREELMKATYTSKHIWFPRAKRYYKKQPLPRRRDYL